MKRLMAYLFVLLGLAMTAEAQRFALKTGRSGRQHAVFFEIFDEILAALQYFLNRKTALDPCRRTALEVPGIGCIGFGDTQVADGIDGAEQHDLPVDGGGIGQVVFI